MQKRTITLGVALAGAVALAGGAYALGAQKDDGSAVANGPGRMGYGYGFGPGPGGPGGPPGGPRGRFMEQRLEEFATKLGVTPEKLREALEKVRPDRGQRDEKRAEMATALGLEQSKVEAALEKARPDGKRFRGGPGGPPPGRPPGDRREGGPRVAALAKALGVTPAKLRTALQEIRQKKRDEFAERLADELGIPVAKVKSALPDKPGP